MVQVIGHCEDALVASRKGRRFQEMTHAQVNRSTVGAGDRRVARLLHGVVRERVAGFGPDDQPRVDGLAERFVEVRLRRIDDRRKQRSAGRAPGAGEAFHDLARGEGQAADLPLHEGGKVVGEAAGYDAVGIPRPVPAPCVERQEPVVVQGANELDDEERISSRLVMDEAAQIREAWGCGLERVGQQLVNLGDRQGAEDDRVNARSRLSERFEHSHQGMRRQDFVVPVRPEQEQVLHARLQEVPEHVEARAVGPLEVIEEQHERMLGARDDGEDALQEQVEAVLGFFDRDVGHRWLRSDQQLELRHETHEEAPVRPERLLQGGAPSSDVDLTLPQDVTDEVLQCFGDRRVRDVALVRVEFASREQGPSGRELALELVDERRFTDARVAGDQRELRGAALHPLERCSQLPARLAPSVQPVGYDEPSREVVTSGWAHVDGSLGLPEGLAGAWVGAVRHGW